MRVCRSLAMFMLLAVTASALHAHDMFWRLTSFFVAPQTALRMPVLNGTFSKSENAIEWARVADLSVVAPTGRAKVDSAQWDTRTDTSWMSYTTAAAGTYVVGLSTKTKEFQLDAKAFNAYLADDGIPDVLAERRKDGSLTKPARERYSKHIKAIFQVGNTHTTDWQTPLGYPAEIVPLSNPYDVHPGGTLRVRCLVESIPIANQLVLVGGRTGSSGDTRLPTQTLRTNGDGIATIQLPRAGRWYIKFIRMVRVSDENVDYESKWATMTMEIR